MTACRAILTTPLIGLLFLIGCGADPEQLKTEAQQALSVGNFSQAQEISTRALAQVPASEKRQIWALERIRLEALARDKQAAEAQQALERLAGEYPAHADADLYIAIASYVREAGDTSGAIDILVAGDQRFPAESEKFKEQILELQEAGLDPAEIERLRSIGYL